MKPINTKLHGVLDYFVGTLLLLSPWIFRFDYGGPEQKIPVITGTLVISMSFFTNYELGAMRLIPVRAHLTTDILIALFLAFSPWIFGFHGTVFLPHLIIGIIAFFSAVFTTPVAFLHRENHFNKSHFGSV